MTDYKRTERACYLGYINQAITVNLLALFFLIFRTDYGISYTGLGTIIFIIFFVQIAVDAILVKLAAGIGYKACAITAHILSAVGLILLGILPKIMDPYAGIIISMVTYSVGGGITEVVVSPIVDSLPSDAKASKMSFLHSFYSIGQFAVILISTLILKLIGSANWNLIPIMWSVLPILDVFLFARAPVPPVSPEAKKAPLLKYFSSPLMYFALILMICSGASEMAMCQWASLFAEQGLGVTKVLGDLLGPCLFAVFMGAGRILYGVYGKKTRIEAALLFCGVITLLCYLLTVASGAPFVALLGCSLCGFGVSIMWPGTLSLTSAHFGPLSGPGLFAILALAGDVGCSLGPWVTGKVSDLYLSVKSGAAPLHALRAGLLTAAVFPLTLTVIIAVYYMRNRRNPSK